MKKEVIILSLILLILILPLASGSDNTWFLKTESVDATIEISSRLTAVPTGDDYNINYVQSTVFFNPEQDWRQNILDSDIQPEAEEVNNSKVFYWDEPDEDEFEFSIRAELHNEYGFRKIFEKISFPLVNLPREIIQYTRSSKNIDSDDEIINQ